jgi:hypothetical protein
MAAAWGALVRQVKTQTEVKGVRECEKRGREDEGKRREKGNKRKGEFTVR